MDLGSPQFWISAFEIVVINILLSGDNAVVIALACRNLPRQQRRWGVIWGAVGAVFLRIILTFFAVRLLTLPYLNLIGGALLIWIEPLAFPVSAIFLGHAIAVLHLQARRALTLSWPGGQRRLAAGERIHTENSYKYTVDGFERLLRDAGYAHTRCWTDALGWFAVFVAN